MSYKSPFPTPNKEVAVEKEIEVATEEPKTSLRQAFDFSLELKDKLLAAKTKQGYEYKVNTFLKWLSEHHPNIKTIDQLDKKTAVAFLNFILLRNSSRHRNNHRTCLSSLMQVLEDNEIITTNFIKNIPILKSIPERNKTYSVTMQEKIFAYLEKEDPILLLYIKFISYNLLRPIEVCRVRIKDVNLIDKTIQFKAKNKPFKTKIIPEILLKDLPDLSNINKDYFLFTPDKIGGEWDATENNRRDHFTKRFKSVVKNHFNLGTDYGLYSFRHTFITKLYRELAKNTAPFHAKSTLMQITGHKTMDALEKYLRDIDAELPKDYSHLLK